ncbi:CHASE4 domain-containing protein [Methanosarcina acetivorans]|uniref:histidine kinase n=1 Tax=Methanosarcina acetivorans (strain ATCC 35395 / DSM 2834 / JCM 12185 / C2A) TaxID=188937 RepID=Q8TNE0_METAC|nr:CHASE4 domain-containing protein [Methanosarcina acetivorans]AAM05738.1 sensory transduction histidine kinase [Methanosarcina acetivorans C2A]
MNVSDKTLIIICLIFASLIAISGGASRTILLSGYLDLEEQDISEKLELVESNFQSEVSRISSLNHDWASWDKTFEFMENGSQTYINSYLTDEIFSEAGINLVLYVNNSGEIVYEKVIDPETGETLQIPSELRRVVHENGSLLALHPGDQKSGLIRTGNGPLIISSRPILTSTDSGPVGGTLIMGRYVTESFLNEIAGIQGIQITLEDVEILGSEPASYFEDLPSRNPDTEIDGQHIEVIDEKWIAGYIRLNDLEEEPGILIKVNSPRTLYAQGKHNLVFFIIIFSLACIIVAIATNYLLKRLIISNLTEIERFVTDIGEENNLSKRLEIKGGDEFIRLSGGINSMLQDLELSQKEVMHRESEKHALLNSLIEVLIYLDSELKIAWTNNKVSEYFGEKTEAITGRTHHELWGDKNPILAPFVRKALNNGKTQSFEINVSDKDSWTGEIWSVTIGSVRDRDGKLIGTIESILDITEVKKSEEKMLQAKILAENSNRSKSEFLSNMSHELRTPLNAVIGFADILNEEGFGPLNKKQKRFVGNISTSGKHLLKLINEILDLSKIEAGKMEFKCTEFSVKEKFDEIKDILFPVFSKKKIRIEFEIGDGITTIYSDEGKFVQVLYNLVSNAIKFTEEGGFVKVSARKNGDMLQLSVKDTGIGITEEDLMKIFHPFVQVDSFSTRQYEGTGLGLALVDQMVQLMGGEICVFSQPGIGSEFICMIPLKNYDRK